jgi:nicotinate-nucleotide adenylyltransferase
VKRIGILGGTFNPIHVGHLTIAQMVQEKFKLEKVIFIPSYLPPHKSSRNVLPARDRYQMVRLAIKSNPYFDLCDFEIKRKKKSYSIDTVTFLREQFPSGTKFFFIIGSDHLATLHTWKQIGEIFKIVTFVSVNRPGFKRSKMKMKVNFITVSGLHISSSYVRRRLAAGKSVHYLLPDNIINYINQRKLYSSR